MAKKFSSVNFRSDDLDILYNARGKEIERLERELGEVRAEYEAQVREARHQLALAWRDVDTAAEALGRSREERRAGRKAATLRTIVGGR